MDSDFDNLQTIEQFCDEARSAPTSHLIALLNPDGLAAMFENAPRDVTRDELTRVLTAIAAEIDRRIPVSVPPQFVDAAKLYVAGPPLKPSMIDSPALSQCTDCGRISSSMPGSRCLMPQPDGSRFSGTFEKR